MDDNDMHPGSCLLWLIVIGFGIWLAIDLIAN